MESWREEFISLALNCHALRFGNFTLKSGRSSPYFFNAGSMSSGASFAALGRCYAAAIDAAGIEYDMLFGPAYKGISLATAAAIALHQRSGRDVPVAFNRKEAKTHGEGGQMMGAPVEGRVLIVDDVITAGTAVREVVAMLRACGARVAGVAVGLDRGEKGRGEVSALTEIARELGCPVISIVHLDDIVSYLRQSDGFRSHLPELLRYQEQWGVARG